uniref:CasJ19 n=3 Tax=unclassified sequences TaxID=12908 RepID=A0ABF7PQ58_9ZZZZ
MPSYKSSRVLVRDVPEELVDHYERSHRVAAFFMRLLLAMRREPYSLRMRDGTEREVDLDETDDFLRSAGCEEPDAVSDDLRSFALAVLHQDNPKKRAFLESENCVSILCLEKSASGTRYYKRPGYQLLKKAIEEEWGWDKFEASLLDERTGEVAEKFAALSMEDWRRFFAARDPDDLGRELLKTDTREGMAAALRLRERGVFPVSVPEHLDLDSLKAAMASAAERLKSWLACNQRAVDEKSELRKRFEEALDGVDPEKYALFEKFAAELQQADYNVTKKLVLAVSAKFPATEPSEFKRGVEILKEDGYKPLWEDFRELGFVYLAERKWERRRGGAAVTLCDADDSPIKVRFGLTGRGRKFVLSAAGSRFLITVKLPCGDVGLTAVPSRYFWNPSVGRTTSNSFRIEFTKRTTENRRYVGEVKEIGLVRQRGRYYFFIDYNFDPEEVSDETKVGRAFFRAPLNESRPKPKDKLTVMGIDLGINPAFAFAVCTLGECQDGIRSPVAKMEDVSFDSTGLRGGIGSQKLHREMHNLSDRCFYGARYIRLSKKLRDRGALNDIEARLLEEKYIPGFRIVHIEDADERRRTVGRTVKEIKQEYKRIRHQFYLRYHTSKRDRTELISAEYFRMLFLVKNLRNLLKSWNRYHWTTGDRERRGGNPDELKSYVRYYNNLRMDTLKKLTCAIVRTAKEHGATLVAMENIQRVDRDDEVKRRKENSLLSLWAPGMVLERVEQELKNEGILAWEVDPRHTSQTSCITDEFGYRSLVAKDTFYFEQDRKIHRIDADVNAAINIARRFLTRYRSLTQLWASLLDDGRYLVNVTRQHERAYLELQTGAPAATLNPTAEASYELVGLSPEEEELAQTRIKRKKREPFYRHEGVWLTREKHREQVHELRNQVLALGNAKIPEIRT